MLIDVMKSKETEPIIVRTHSGAFVEPNKHVDLLVAVDTEEHARTASLNLRKFLPEGLERVYPNHDWICWLLGRRNTRLHECADDLQMPRCDHPRAFRNTKNGQRVVIHQPYVIGEHDLALFSRESKFFADKHGLYVRISREDSFHYPSATVLVEYRRLDF
jgi:hypothetical protein